MMLWGVWDSANSAGKEASRSPGRRPCTFVLRLSDSDDLAESMILPSQAGKIDSDDYFATPVANLPAAARYPGRKLPWSLPVRHNSNGTAARPPGPPQAMRPPAA